MEKNESREWAINEIERDLGNINDLREARHEAKDRSTQDHLSRQMRELNADIKALRESYDVTFGEYLRLLVKQTGLSQSAFAQAMEVPVRTLENWLAGTRCPNRMVQLAIEGNYNGIMNDRVKKLGQPVKHYAHDERRDRLISTDHLTKVKDQLGDVFVVFLQRHKDLLHLRWHRTGRGRTRDLHQGHHQGGAERNKLQERDHRQERERLLRILMPPIFDF